MEKLNHNRLAEGEATGHAHRVESENFELWDNNGDKVLNVPDGTKVTHEEHKEIELPPGDYDISIVQEYDHAEEEVKNVVD